MTLTLLTDYTDLGLDHGWLQHRLSEGFFKEIYLILEPEVWLSMPVVF